MSQTLHQRQFFAAYEHEPKWLGDELNEHLTEELASYRPGDKLVFWTCVAIGLGFVLGAFLV